MARITIDLSQLPAFLQAKVESIAKANFSPALKVCRQLIVSDAKDAFQQGRDPVDGSAWAPLKRPRKLKKQEIASAKKDLKAIGKPTDQETVRWLAKGKQKPLLDTGMMRASLTGNSAGHVEMITPTSLEVGTNLKSKKGFPYPVIHQEGGKHIPRRRFLGLSTKLIERITQVISDYAAKILAK